jgi:hypothetical protein
MVVGIVLLIGFMLSIMFTVWGAVGLIPFPIAIVGYTALIGACFLAQLI